MGAIAGIIQISGGSPSIDQLTPLLANMSKRAPGGWKIQSSGPVLMAQVIHQTASSAAAASDAEPIFISVTDAHLDRLDDLRRALGAAPCESAEALIALAWQRWSIALPDRLLGDFALLIWDKRSNRLLAARDPLGVKPLCYARIPGGWAFASEPRALLAIPGVNANLNHRRIAAYLGACFPNRRETFFEGIQRLEPGHRLIIDNAGLRVESYWSPDLASAGPIVGSQAPAETFRELLVDAVACRISGHERPGMLVSGGLDSAGILGIARRLPAGSSPAHPHEVFSAIFPDGSPGAEGKYLSLLKEGFDEPWHEIQIEGQTPLGSVDEIYKTVNEPFHAPNLYIYWALAKAVQAGGISLLLDGVDGDTVVGHGLEHLEELLCRCRLMRLHRMAMGLSRRYRRPEWRFFLHFAALPWILRGSSGLRLRLGPAPRPAILRPDFARRIGWTDLVREASANAPGGGSLAQSHWRQVASGVLAHYLEVNDQAASGFGFASRHPYFDRRLVEFCLALPPEQRLDDGWDRLIQRRGLEGLVPPEICWRLDKAYWGADFEERFINQDWPELENEKLLETGLLDDFVDRTALAGIAERCRRGSRRRGDIMALWVTATLAYWLRNLPSC